MLRREQVGFVFQAFNLIPTLTAAREHHAARRPRPARSLDRAWLDTVIDTVGLRDRLRHRPSELSGGQQQRVAVARALASAAGDRLRRRAHRQPRLPRRRARVLGFLRRAVDDLDQTIVMVTHDPTAAPYADRVVFLSDGRIVDEMPAPTAGRGPRPAEGARRPAGGRYQPDGRLTCCASV